MSEEASPDLLMLTRVHQIYRGELPDSAEAKQWLAGRGITDARVIERFELGFAKGILKRILPYEQVAHRKLREAGLLYGPGRGQETLEGCVVIPIYDTGGRMVELIGYPIAGGSSRRAGSEGGVFNWGAMKSNPCVTLLRDPLEAVSQIAAGDEAVIALMEDRWTTLTDNTFSQLAPHSVVVQDKNDRTGIVDRLQALGLCGDLQSDPPEADELIENGFPSIFGRRRYVVQAISRENPRHLRALVRAVGTTKGRFHLDAIDLYSSRDRSIFVREASLLFGEEPSIIEADLTRLVSMAEDHLSKGAGSNGIKLSEESTREGMEMLRDPKLLDRIVEDIGSLGVVGEYSNKLMGYLVAISRKLERPLSILIVSRSGAGKSALAEAVAKLVPSEDLHPITRFTGKGLFYQRDQTLRHKLIFVDEDKGLTEATYPLRILQSAQRLAVATAHGLYEVEGPVALMLSTTQIAFNEETSGRFIITSADESRQQTQRVLAEQREREAGRIPAAESIIRRHHAMQRCLKPVKVVNPYARYLTFPDRNLSARREQPKYLGIMRVIAFLRQFQKKEQNGEISVELEDIEVANRLADSMFGQSMDVLSPPARRLLEGLYSWKPRGSFTRREVQGALGWSTTQTWAHLSELVQYEWVIDRGSRPKKFELAWDGREGKVLLGLRPVDEIRQLAIRDHSGSFGKEQT